MGTDKQSVTEGETTQDRLSRLAQELGLVDWREWLRDFEPGAVLAALVQLDLETLPFMGEG